MTDNKLVKPVIDAATLTGLAAGIGWAAKKEFKDVEKDKKLLEQEIGNLCSLIEQVMKDKGKMMQALLNAQAVQDGEVNQELKNNREAEQELKKYNIIEQVRNIFSESEKTEKLLKYFDYNHLENEIKLKLELITNFFLETTIFYFILNI